MIKNTVYKIKDGTDLNEFAKLGYELLPDQRLTLIKFVEQPLDSKLPQNMLEMIYDNAEWKERVYSKNKKVLRETLGLRYSRTTGKAIIDEKFKKVLTMWRIQIEAADSEDKWIGFTCLDRFYNNVFYGTQVLDLYCADEIALLKEKGLIEEIEVENDN